MKKNALLTALSTASILLIIIVFNACKHQIPLYVNTPVTGGAQPCSPDTAYFQNQILPLFISNCATSGCHDAITHKEDIILNSYTNIMNSGTIRPGVSSNSESYKLMITTSSKKMPPAPNAPMTLAQTNLIKKWIDQGAKNNACNDCDTTGIMKYSTNIQPIMQSYCVGCHNSSSLGGGINLSTYTFVKTQVTNGKLMGSINWASGYKAMPQGGQKLSSCKINQIQKWISAGALNN